MKISSIHTKELSLLESTMAGTDPATRRYLRNMHENFVVPYVKYLNGINTRLTEAELTPDQINQLFGTVAQGAQASGGNSTMIGKMLPDSIKKKFSDSLPPADAGEVPGFDQKAQAAVAQVQDPAAKKSLMQLIKTGLQNPATQKLIIAGVQGIAGVAAGALTGGLGGKLGATAAGAITGGLVGLVAAKLQGQDWKSAAKAGLKGAAVGGAGGLAGSLASGAAGAAMDAMKGNSAAELPGASLGVGQELPDGEVISALDSSNPNAGVTITKPDGSTYSVSRDTAQAMTGQQGISPQATGPVSQGVSSDPTAGVTDSPAASSGITTRPTNLPPLNNLDGSERPGAAAANAAASAPAPTIGQNFDAGIAPIGPDGTPMKEVPFDEPSTGGLDNIKPGLAAPIGADGKPMQEVPFDEPTGGLDNIKPGLAAPMGADGKPMKEVPMDEPTTGLDNIKPGLAAPIGADGKPMQEVPMDEPTSTADAGTGGQEISADGKPYPEGLTAQQKQIYDNPIQVGSNNTGTVSFTDGAKMDAVFVPPGGMTPRFPAGSQKMDFPFDGKMVTGYVVGNKVWFPNFGTAQTESKKIKARALTEYIDKDMTVRMWAINESVGKPRGGVQLTEAGIGDMVGKIGSWLKTKGQNLTQTVTADKLMQAWNKAGKPTDSEKVAELLAKQGVAPELVASAYKSMGIPAAAAPGDKIEPTMEPAAPAQQPAQAQQPAAPAATPKSAANPFGQMTSQLAKPAEPAEPAEPAAQTQQPAAEPAAPAQQPAAAGSSLFANPAKLSASFETFLDAGGSVPPRMRGVLKDILLTALRTVETRQRKINNIVKEAKKIQGQIVKIKKQKQRL